MKFPLLLLVLLFACSASACLATSGTRRRAECELVAAVLVAEAGGEPTNGMRAVLEVIDNRARVEHKTRSQVVTVGNQFSCLNRCTAEDLVVQGRKHPKWVTALRLVRTGKRTNFTGGALYYHRDNVLPGWSARQMPCAWIGHHKFYRALK